MYLVSEANRTLHCLEIKACDVELVHTQAEIEALPDGSEILSVYTENDIETYRDELFYVGQVLGGFFRISREGKLELIKNGNQPVMMVSDRNRFSSSFSDFIARHTAVSSTNIKTQTAEYYALEPDDGLTMNLGVNPLLQFGLEETRKALLENIRVDLSVIRHWTWGMWWCFRRQRRRMCSFLQWYWWT